MGRTLLNTKSHSWQMFNQMSKQTGWITWCLSSYRCLNKCLGGACSSNPINHCIYIGKILSACVGKITSLLKVLFCLTYCQFMKLWQLAPSHTLYLPLLPAFLSQSFDSFVFDAAAPHGLTCLSFPGRVRQTAVRDRNRKREREKQGR